MLYLLFNDNSLIMRFFAKIIPCGVVILTAERFYHEYGPILVLKIPKFQNVIFGQILSMFHSSINLNISQFYSFCKFFFKTRVAKRWNEHYYSRFWTGHPSYPSMYHLTIKKLYILNGHY